jgi:hypothetical protein
VSDQDEEALDLVARMATTWSKWLQINKTQKVKLAGLTPAAAELQMKAERDRSFWDELLRRAQNEGYRDRDAEVALSYEAWTLIKMQMPLPSPLSTYVENILLEKIADCNRRQGGQGRWAYRNAFIVQANHQLKLTLGVESAEKRYAVIARVLQSLGYRLKARGAVEPVCQP